MYINVYKLWCSAIGTVLQLLRGGGGGGGEDKNHDRFAVCVVKGVLIVSHVPHRLTHTVWHFLEHSGSSVLKNNKKRWWHHLVITCSRSHWASCDRAPHARTV